VLQAIIGGLTSGAIYALLGLGIVLVFSVSRFVNLAQGEFYVYGALLSTTLVAAGLPLVVSALLAIAAVAVLAAALDRVLFSRLSDAPHATQLLGGIGVALAMAGAARLIWGTDERSLPELFEVEPLGLFGARLSVQAVLLFVALALTCLLIWALLTRTMLGMKMRAVAALSSRAGQIGVDVRSVTTVSFAIAGAVGALAGVVVTPLVFVSYQTGLLLTVYGFIAAAFGGLRSVRGAVLGGLLLGILEALTAYYIDSALKTPIALSVLVLVLIYRSFWEGAWAGALSLAAWRRRALSIPPSLPALAFGSPVRQLLPTRSAIVGVGVVTAFALTGPSFLPPYWVTVWSFIGIFVIVGIGLDLLLGYTGQLSLGQTTFTGVAAYLVALSPTWWEISAWTAAAIAVVGTASVALVLGFFVLRLRGYYFTLATLAVAIGAEALFNGLPTQLGGPSGVGVLTTLSVFGYDLNTPARLFAATWLVVGVALALALRLVRSRFGQSMRAVGHDEHLAAAAAVAPFPVKLKVFVASSVLAAVAGVLYAHVLLFVSPPILGFTGGFDAVIGLLLGGFGTVWGALIGIPIIRLLPEVGAEYADYQLLIYGLLVIALVVALPEGLVGTARRVWQRLQGKTTVSRAETVAVTQSEEPKGATAGGEVPMGLAPVLLGQQLTKRFGGLTALSDVDVTVRAGSILGLIGPNGAGKSTCLSMLAGSLQPDTGHISLCGEDVTRLPADARAARGLARTFQLPRVPADMTVLDVATLGAFRRGSSGLLRGVVGATRSEQRGMQQAGYDALAAAGIAHLADAPAEKLSTGEQKMLELARALAASPSVLLLDEPAGGLAEEEVTRLAEVLTRLAGDGLAIVLVEHEMRLVMKVCAEIVVLNAGRVIGTGTPNDVRANQEVLDAYLGV
jgi:branched-chain amino acid transport system permease protein